MTLKKTIVIGLVLLLFIGAGITTALASPNISGILSQWFHNKTEDAIKDIDTTIDDEVEKHTAQLKKELQPKISAAKKKSLPTPNNKTTGY